LLSWTISIRRRLKARPVVGAYKVDDLLLTGPEEFAEQQSNGTNRPRIRALEFCNRSILGALVALAA
jgi:hypothetical protein